jgi:hypothetical protein
MIAKNETDIFRPIEIQVPEFTTGQASEILGIDTWRLQKFLDSPTFKLRPNRLVGPAGRGSRRIFRDTDLYRIAIAARMTEDGFTAAVAADAASQLDKVDVSGSDVQGRSQDYVLCLVRTKGRPQAEVLYDMKSAKSREGCYYQLRLSEVLKPIRKRVNEYSKTAKKERS